MYTDESMGWKIAKIAMLLIALLVCAAMIIGGFVWFTSGSLF